MNATTTPSTARRPAGECAPTRPDRDDRRRLKVWVRPDFTDVETPMEVTAYVARG